MKKSDVRARKITKGFTYPRRIAAARQNGQSSNPPSSTHLRVLSSWKRELRQA